MKFFLSMILAQMVMKISHRGYIDSKFTMENSHRSITNAINNDFDVIELDVQLTKDNIIILHHDLYINTLKSDDLKPDDLNYKLISETNYSDLKKIKKEILTINELFKIDNLDKKSLYLDLKGSDELSKELINFFDNNFVFNNDIYLGSFNKNHLTDLSIYNKINNLNFKLGYITDNRLLKNDLDNWKKNYDIDFLSLSWEMLRNDTLEYLNNNDIKCFTFTCKNKLILDYIKRFNIDGIVSDLII